MSKIIITVEQLSDGTWCASSNLDKFAYATHWTPQKALSTLLNAHYELKQAAKDNKSKK